jgi:Butirosin biosynthesis protein H, N-terminal
MKVVLAPMTFWFHDLCSCLQDCIATVLIYHKHDPTLILGASWEFYYSPADVQREEFYHPLPRPTLAESMMPFHPIHSAWHATDDAERAWADVKALVAEGQPVIVAVDNFHVPFRPAYGDVHAAHLIVVFGFDEATDEVYVLDSTPPTKCGPIPLRDFLVARSSDNPVSGERDFFFAGAAVANRWLQLDIGTPLPTLTRAWATEVIATNLRRFREPAADSGWSGIAGLTHYLASICERSLGPDAGDALQELYTVGWTAQGSTALHADFLMQAGRQLGWEHLVEVGRHVDRLANEWTALRMFGAHGFMQPTVIAERLRQRTITFLSNYEQTLQLLEWAIAE